MALSLGQATNLLTAVERLKTVTFGHATLLETILGTRMDDKDKVRILRVLKDVCKNIEKATDALSTAVRE